MLRHVSRASFIAILALTACRSNGGSSSATDPATGYTGPIGAGAYWLVDPSSKVQPSTAPGALSGTIALEGPRASTEAYQIVLRPTGGGLRNVNATATDLRSDAGATIAAANLTLFREFFIDFGSIDRKRNVGGVLPVPENSPTGDSKLPDPLIPLVDPYSGRPAGAPFDVWPETNRPLWLDLRIPASAAPGNYRGEIRITSDGQDPLVVPVVLTVWDLTLPDSASVTTYFKIDWSDVNGFHAGMDTGLSERPPQDEGLREAVRGAGARTSRELPPDVGALSERLLAADPCAVGRARRRPRPLHGRLSLGRRRPEHLLRRRHLRRGPHDLQ
jgi:hypothetical protein